MAGQDIVIRSVEYDGVPAVEIPKKTSGVATFVDPSDATLSSGAQLRNGVKAIDGSGTLITGSMTEKSAQTYTPTTSDQTIASGQYLAGAQTVKGDPNLVSANIVSGKSIFNVQGSAAVPVISQDNVTKILSIS